MTARGNTWLRLAPSVALGSASICLLVALLVSAIAPRGGSAAPPEPQKKLDPAAWGNDHVGQKVPPYVESGECLFCHRLGAGVSWAKNKHNRTMREPEPGEPAMAALTADPAAKPLAQEVQLIMGDTRAQRFLHRSAAYGKVDMLSTTALFGRGRRPRLEPAGKPHWDTEAFALECAGCHATGVDPETHAFSAVSLDCFPCHGDAPEEHATDPKLMPLAKARRDSPRVVTSICASCHVRSGKSRSNGLPYPNNFVAGDNLFKDFEVDFDQADDESLNPADRHVMQNVRDVVVYGRESTTCLTCHDVHNSSTKAHRDLPVEKSCLVCHEDTKPIKGHKTYEVHSARCRY